MYLPVALALMTAMALVLVIAPLMRATRLPPTRGEFDRTVYRDQMKELERDRARGLIGETEAASARLEIERRMLAADRGSEGEAPAARPVPWLAAALALTLAGGAGALYLVRGSPGVPDQPASEAKDTDARDLASSAAALEQRLAAKPRDGEGWELLGETQAQLGDWDKTADAYRHAAALAPENADYAAAYGEALVEQASGVVTPAADAAFKGALARDPRNAVSRYYLALADAQVGRTGAAIAAWQQLAAEAPDNAPVRAALQQRIAETAQAAGIAAPPLAPPATAAAAAPTTAAGEPPSPPPGPDAEQMAAAANMSPEDRQAMIRTMVGRLAATMEASPGNRDGWLRLARAYGVLGERDKAADAFDRAAALDPKNVEIPLGEIDTLLGGQTPQGPLPERARGALKRAQAIAPEEPEVLWYLGLEAAQEKKPDEAAGYWRKLLAALPANAPERDTVSKALETLKPQR